MYHIELYRVKVLGHSFITSLTIFIFFTKIITDSQFSLTITQIKTQVLV